MAVLGRRRTLQVLGLCCCSWNHARISALSFQQPIRKAYFRSLPSSSALHAQPKRGNVVDSYQTVSVNCKCGERLFRYKKKNGTKSNLIKCFVERIAEDSAGVLESQGPDALEYHCPACQTRFARSATIRGLPALKLVGGKTRMTKK